METIAPDGARTIWAGTYSGGLAKLEHDKWTVLDKENGLPSNRVYTAHEVKIGGKRELWVGTGGGGIAVLDLDSPDSKIKTISTENSDLVPSDTVYQIFQDSKNRVYATTNKGVSRITLDESGDIASHRAYFFTTEDGLPDDECVSGASFVDSKGRVWIGTVRGAAVLNVAEEFADVEGETLFMEKVLIGDKETALKPNSVLPYYQNNIVFEYVMPTNFRESSTLYRTQMFNLEDKPTEWTKEPRREFTFMPSGDFTFKIWGKDSNGNISKPLEIPFRIRPAWWQTWWAYLLYVLVTAVIVGFIAYLFYRNRYRRMLEVERVRTRIATDLHDDIGSSLSKISILSEVLSQDNDRMSVDEKESLTAIAETSREVVGSMSDMVWSINPNRDNLRDTVQRMRRFASDVLSAKDIQFTFNAPNNEKEIKLDVDLRRQIYLVFKESVNNAVKHSGSTKIEINLVRERDGILLSVRDNGKGFNSGDLSDGNGLINIKSRTDVIGGTLKIDSSKGKGTYVELKIPQRQRRIVS